MSTSHTETFTMVDLAPPTSAASALPTYENSTSFFVYYTASDGFGTGLGNITLWYRQGESVVWIQFATQAGASSGQFAFVATSNGHYEFATTADDLAGNKQPGPAANNNTWTIVDTTRPIVTSFSPTVTNATSSPIIQITFSKSMDRKSVEGAFSVSGGVNGTFQWSSDSRSVTFLASGALQAGTTYTVVLGTTATDLAGNQMLDPLTYHFSTAAAPPAGLALSSFWWLIPILAAVVGTALFLVMRRRTAAAPKPAVPTPAAKTKEAIIEDVFLLNHRDGILIKHETRRLRPNVDTDILTGMLTAVQQFVKIGR